MDHDGRLPQRLADALLDAEESDYVRLTADWIASAGDVSVPASETSIPLIDALVAAAASHVAVTRGEAAPSWTAGHALSSFWHPSPPAFLAWSFAHAPGAFKCRGLLIEADSLVSV
jgi:hypothetical protein